MSHTLERAIERLREMPEDRQEQIARLLLHELEEDQRWERSTEAHTDKLQRVVVEVLQADDQGRCEPLDVDTL